MSQGHRRRTSGIPTLTFAVDDAFKHARRQLQDQVRRIQGHIKDHPTPSRQLSFELTLQGSLDFSRRAMVKKYISTAIASLAAEHPDSGWHTCDLRRGAW